MKHILKLTALLLTTVLCSLIAACVNKLIKSEPAKSKTIKSETGIEMVWIKPGTFKMGSPANEPERFDDETQHQVTLTKGFYMGKYEVTQEQYKAVTGTNPSHFSGNGRLPVEQVSWRDALVFCNKLSISEGLNPVYSISGKTNPAEWGKIPTDENDIWDAVKMVSGANGYRLPTEAEWEYACRAGTTTPFNTGNNITTDQANYDGTNPYNNNPAGIFRETTTPAGSFAPNAWGLYDMHGNVCEWCWDRKEHYSGNAVTDPVGAVAGRYRVGRGGSWGHVS